MWHEYERRKSKLRERLDEKYSEYILFKPEGWIKEYDEGIRQISEDLKV